MGEREGVDGREGGSGGWGRGMGVDGREREGVEDGEREERDRSKPKQ